MCMNSELILVGLLVVTAFAFPHGDGKPGSASTSRTELEKRLKKFFGDVDPADRRRRLAVLAAKASGRFNRTSPSIKIPSGMSIPKSERKPTLWEVNKEHGVTEYLYQGDIHLSNAQLETLEKRSGPGIGRIRRQVLADAVLWPNATVHYTVSDNYTEAEVNIIRRGLAQISAHTCVNFVENSNSPNWVEVFRGPGCYSPIGMQKKKGQQLSLGNGCVDEGTVMHEFIHALGSDHTQSRSDRDDFLDFNPDAVEPKMISNFDKLLASESINYVPYEYGSIMQYEPFSFSMRETIPTMIPKKDKYFYTMGTSLISFYDLVTVNSLYKCKCGCPKTISCYNGGYRNPRNCSECNCPLGYGGVSCDERPDDGCGETWEVEPKWGKRDFIVGTDEETEREEYEICTHWLTAPKGRTIEVSLESMQNEKCSYGCGTNGIEFKVYQDMKLVNPRFCCGTQTAAFNSTLNPTPIIVYNKLQLAKFEVYARYW